MQCQERLKITKSAILLQLLSIELNFAHVPMKLHRRDTEFMAIPWELDPDPSRRSTAARENDENWRIFRDKIAYPTPSSRHERPPTTPFIAYG